MIISRACSVGRRLPLSHPLLVSKCSPSSSEMSTQSLSPDDDGDTSNGENTGVMTRRTREIYEQLTSNNIDEMVKRRAVSKVRKQ